jgi:sec-independent protein translocase protein TatA
MRIGPFGIWEILIILVVVLLIFGPRRLPEMAKGLGQSVRAFRKELRDMKSDSTWTATTRRAPLPKPSPASAEAPGPRRPAPAPSDRQRDGPTAGGGDARPDREEGRRRPCRPRHGRRRDGRRGPATLR